MIKKITPHPSIGKVVDYYWIEKQESENVKILPDGTLSILFNLGSPIKIVGANGVHNDLENNLIIGTHKKYYSLQKDEGNYLIGIKFKQGGAYHFFKFPVAQFSNKIASLNEILNGESEQLREILQAKKTSDDIKKILDRYLLMKIDQLNGAFDIVDFAINKVKVNGSPALIKNLCEAANISNKHLIALFNEKVGLSPKLVHRINKFLKVIELIQDKKVINWSEIAYQCQYYDQAHLINDFRNFSGISPKKYHDNLRANGLRIVVT